MPITAMILVVAALALRLPHFGDPAYMIDEQFYLVVGDRMLHGALPFVDIWDRKPIGLFLLYAAIRLLGGEGIVQYQAVATLFAAATAAMIALAARRSAAPFGALCAAFLYLVWLEVDEGGGGQASVFYNLFTVAGAWFVLRAGDADDRRTFFHRGLGAMAMIGIAIQIKYTVLFEGVFFGLVLAWGSLRRSATIGEAVGLTAAFAATALAPTILALASYVAIGAGKAFWFANFISIFLRGPGDPAEVAFRLRVHAVRLAPFALCAVASFCLLRRDEDDRGRRDRIMVFGWLIAALLGFAAVGTFYFHYALPLLVPFTIAAAPLLGRAPVGSVVALLIAATGLRSLGWPATEAALISRQQIDGIVALIPADVDRRCMLVFDGPSILYLKTNACLPTRYAFSDHLSAANEAAAIGVDPAAELRRTLATAPRAIVLSHQMIRPPNFASWAVMGAALRRDYRLAGARPFQNRTIEVYVRR